MLQIHNALTLILSVSTITSILVVSVALLSKSLKNRDEYPEMDERDFVVRHSDKALSTHVYMLIAGGIFQAAALLLPTSDTLRTVVVVLAALNVFYLSWYTAHASAFKLTASGNVFTCKRFMKPGFVFDVTDIKLIDVHFDNLGQLRYIALHSSAEILVSVMPQKMDHKGYSLLVSRLRRLDIKGNERLPDTSVPVQPWGIGFFGLDYIGLAMVAVQWCVFGAAFLPYFAFKLPFEDVIFLSVAIVVLGNSAIIWALRRVGKLRKFHTVSALVFLAGMAIALALLYS